MCLNRLGKQCGPCWVSTSPGGLGLWYVQAEGAHVTSHIKTGHWASKELPGGRYFMSVVVTQSWRDRGPLVWLHWQPGLASLDLVSCALSFLRSKSEPGAGLCAQSESSQQVTCLQEVLETAWRHRRATPGSSPIIRGQWILSNISHISIQSHNRKKCNKSPRIFTLDCAL